LNVVVDNGGLKSWESLAKIHNDNNVTLIMWFYLFLMNYLIRLQPDVNRLLRPRELF